MRRFLLLALSVVMGCLAFTPEAMAGGPDPEDYPLRVLIFHYSARSRHGRESKSFSEVPDYVDGEGVADVFENGTPESFLFTYSCMDALRASTGYMTLPARWKKRGKTVEILLPEAGKPWNNVACELRTEMRDGLAFYWKDGKMLEEASATFKDWMVKHQYDPEKGKDEPVGTDSEPIGNGESSSQR
jgi:hypothetical protein